MAATEGLGNQLTYVGLGYVIHGYIPYAAFGKLARQDVGCVLCTAIYGAVNHHDRALILRRIGAPFVILLYDPWEIIPPNRTMQGADGVDLHRSGFGQHILHLLAVFAYDIGVIAAGVGQPIPLQN